MIKNLIIGSSFACVGGILALIKKREKATIILGNNPKKINEVFNIQLPTRDWSRYENNIKSAFYANNFNVNKKYNFISYLGPGGLSNIWGKVINDKIAFSKNLINFILKKLKIKITKIPIFKKCIYFYKFNNLVLDPIKILRKYPKKLSIIKNLYVVKINYDYKKKFFIIFLSNQKNIRCKKLYLASGLFSSISLIKSLFKNNFNKKKINLSHNNLLYGFSLLKKKTVKNLIDNINDFYYFDKSYKKFCGRISILNDKIIRRYNLNPFFKIILFLSTFFGYKVLILNLMYKRKNNSTQIIVGKTKFIFQAKPDNNIKIISLAKSMLKKNFKSNFFFPFKSKIGSDFHYSSNIIKNINFTDENKSIFKKLFILDSSCVINKPFFPVFFYIVNSYYRVLNNVNLLKLNKII